MIDKKHTITFCKIAFSWKPIQVIKGRHRRTLFSSLHLLDLLICKHLHHPQWESWPSWCELRTTLPWETKLVWQEVFHRQAIQTFTYKLFAGWVFTWGLNRMMGNSTVRSAEAVIHRLTYEDTQEIKIDVAFIENQLIIQILIHCIS